MTALRQRLTCHRLTFSIPLVQARDLRAAHGNPTGSPISRVLGIRRKVSLARMMVSSADQTVPAVTRSRELYRLALFTIPLALNPAS